MATRRRCLLGDPYIPYEPLVFWRTLKGNIPRNALKHMLDVIDERNEWIQWIHDMLAFHEPKIYFWCISSSRKLQMDKGRLFFKRKGPRTLNMNRFLNHQGSGSTQKPCIFRIIQNLPKSRGVYPLEIWHRYLKWRHIWREIHLSTHQLGYVKFRGCRFRSPKNQI